MINKLKYIAIALMMSSCGNDCIKTICKITNNANKEVYVLDYRPFNSSDGSVEFTLENKKYVLTDFSMEISYDKIEGCINE